MSIFWARITKPHLVFARAEGSTGCHPHPLSGWRRWEGWNWHKVNVVQGGTGYRVNVVQGGTGYRVDVVHGGTWYRVDVVQGGKG